MSVPASSEPNRVPAQPAIQTLPLGLFAATIAGGALLVGAEDWRLGTLVIIGGLLGVALHHGAFGFTSAYRRALMARDMGAVRAQIVMIALAMVLFAPLLAEGRALGGGINGALAPTDGRVVVGAFLFGLGMQIAGGCASGTLFTLGGGSLRMVLALAAFCAGGFWATFHLGFWNTLPSAGTVAFHREFGWGGALALSLAALAGLWLALARLARGPQTPLAGGGIAGRPWALLRGPWPLLWAALALAGLNVATLVIAGHPWSITWGLTLWAAKLAQGFGWAPEASAFWADGFPARALAQPIWRDTTSVMNAAIILGAGLAAALAGRFRPGLTAAPGALVASVIGGLALGYGARLAYGCNIGAFFSGVASQSLHGWVWLGAALTGTWIGIHLRPLFGLAKDR
jgi:uncharacterized membrane protein YedE/YeeE